MKRSILKSILLSFIVGGMPSFAQTKDQGKLHITATMKNMNDTVLIMVADMQKMQNHEPIYTDTLRTANGSFSTMIPMDCAWTVMVYNMKNGQPVGQFMFCGVPGEKCEIVGDWANECKLGGSDFYNQYNAMTETTASLQQENTNLMIECDKRLEAGGPEKDVMDYHNRKAGEIQDRITAKQMEYVRQNPKSETCSILLYDLPAEKVEETYAMMDTSIKNGRMKNYIQQALLQAREELKHMVAAAALEPGVEAPDFTLLDINGEQLSLSSLRGKYVILDFWGSWCAWCMEGMPKMKKYYKKYKNKMEILGIDCNETEKMWKTAVKQNKLPWKHVINGKGENSILPLYGVDGFPTKVILDPKGRIVRLIVGEDPQFYPYLDSLFE